MDISPYMMSLATRKNLFFMKYSFSSNLNTDEWGGGFVKFVFTVAFMEMFTCVPNLSCVSFSNLKHCGK